MHKLMAVKKSSLSLDSSESDSEELPTFAFLKKKLSSIKRRQPQEDEKIVVVDISDSEASCPSPKWKEPPPIPEAAETVIQTEPVRVLSSGSENEEEFMPLAERLICKFLTHKQLSPEKSSSPFERVLDQNNERASHSSYLPFKRPKKKTIRHGKLLTELIFIFIFNNQRQY